MSILHFDPPPQQLYSAALRAELDKDVSQPGAAATFPVFELTSPESVLRYGGIGSSSGLYEPKIRSFGSVSIGPDLRSATLGATTANVELIDIDENADRHRSFAKLYARNRASMEGSLAALKLYFREGFTERDAFTFFSGILETPAYRGNGIWQLTIRPRDTELRFGNVPRIGVTAADWPNIHSSAAGQYYPIIFGIHDSTGISAKGMVPCLYVDTVGFRYLVSLGACKAVRAVYKDGAVVSTSLYTVTRPIVGGKQVTLLDFTADQTVNASITADVEGLTDVHDGTGTLITNQATGILYVLGLFVFNDWRSGAYPSFASLQVNLARIADLSRYFTNHGYEFAIRLGGSKQDSAESLVNKWLSDNDARAWWDNEGLLSFGVIDHGEDDIYPDEEWIQEAAVQQLQIPQDFQGAPVRQLSIQYLYDNAQGRYASTLEVADISMARRVTGSRTVLWAGARLGA